MRELEAVVSLSEFQRNFAAWIAHNFPDAPRALTALSVAEEAGELCRAVLKQAQGIRGRPEDWEKEIAKEIGDVIIAATWVATVCNLDLQTVLEHRWAEVVKRDWVANPTGHGTPS